MFTGLIEAVAQVVAISKTQLQIQTELAVQVNKGESIAVNGVCLTVSQIKEQILLFDFLPETYQTSNFQYLAVNDLVNLERALLANGRLDGHLVSGHIDGVCQVLKIEQRKDTYLLTLQLPERLIKYVAVKGSLALNGISLTVQNIEYYRLQVAIIPFTYQNTCLKNITVNDYLNVEVDLIARYLENLITKPKNELSYQQLISQGFI